MKYWLDTEFMEDGPNAPIYLLSIGLVAEDGRELYLENRDAPVEKANAWVKQNVLPHLDLANGVSCDEIRNRVLAFIRDDKSPEFWGYYPAYDWVVFAGLFGRMVDLPKGFPKSCMDLRQWAFQLHNPKLPRQRTAQHNALNDARWNQMIWNHLNSIANSKAA